MLAAFILFLNIPSLLLSQTDTTVVNKDKFYSYHLLNPANVNDIIKATDPSVNSMVNKTYVVGSYYIPEKFEEGMILNRHNQTEKVKLRYSIKKDHIEILKNNAAYTLNPQLCKGVVIGNRIFIPYEVDKGNKVEFQYFELLVEGEISLLKKYDFVLRRSDSQQYQSKKLDHDEIIVTEKLYTISELNGLQKLKKKKKEILTLFQMKAEEVSEFIERSQLSVKKEEDIVKIFTFYNS